MFRGVIEVQSADSTPVATLTSVDPPTRYVIEVQASSVDNNGNTSAFHSSNMHHHS